MNKRIFIVWARFHRRSELLAKYLGATVQYVNYGQGGRFYQAPLRYIVQSYMTWRILRTERPEVIFVQNPPIFAVLIVALYSFFWRAQFIIDSHTGAFLGQRWGWSVGLHRVFSKRALTTIVHNKSQEKLVQKWGCPYHVVGFIPDEYSPVEPYALSEKQNIAVICAFEVDEPIEILFEAARHLKNVNFYVTGNPKRLDRSLLMKKPDNICLTGYLPYERYLGLLRGVDAVMDLVNNEHTLLMGGFEAVSLGVPLIVSDWPLLRDYFSQGTVYVPNTIEGICEGVRQAQREQTQLQGDIIQLRELLQAEWIGKLVELQNLLDKPVTEAIK